MLLSTLQRVAHLERGARRPELARSSKWPLAEEVARQLREMAQARQVAVRVDPGLPVLLIDPARLELALLNLISNGIKCSDPAKPDRFVEIRFDGQSDSTCTICVRDNGLGIPDDAKPAVFKRFFRAHAELDDRLGIDGSGLGLAVVAECVQALGGAITCESRAGEEARPSTSSSRQVSLPSSIVNRPQSSIDNRRTIDNQQSTVQGGSDSRNIRSWRAGLPRRSANRRRLRSAGGRRSVKAVAARRRADRFGKTLAAFLGALDDLLQEGLRGPLPDEVRVVYVSPLKALSADIVKNLGEPRRGSGNWRRRRASTRRALRRRCGPATRLNPSAPRCRVLRRTFLVTTPESLYLLLTAERSREMLRTARMVIVDEIHAVIGTRRGAHLALSLERLEALTEGTLQRVGLSATQNPIEEAARHLIGTDRTECAIVDEGHRRKWILRWRSRGRRSKR